MLAKSQQLSSWGRRFKGWWFSTGLTNILPVSPSEWELEQDFLYNLCIQISKQYITQSLCFLWVFFFFLVSPCCKVYQYLACTLGFFCLFVYFLIGFGEPCCRMHLYGGFALVCLLFVHVFVYFNMRPLQERASLAQWELMGRLCLNLPC